MVAVLFLAASIFATSLYTNYLNNPILFAVILVTVRALLGIKFFLTKRAYCKESRPKGPGFGLPPGRGLSMTLLCSTYLLKLLQAEPIISDLAQRTRISNFY